VLGVVTLAIDVAERIKIGASDLAVFPLNLGGNVFGWTAGRDESFAVLDAYFAGGGNFIDTADSYSAWVAGNCGGESESIIGEWMAARGRRSDVIVATKVGGHPEYRGLAPDTIRRAVDASLQRLGTDFIDLYYTHHDDESVPVEQIMTTLDELVRAGKVRAIGVSNLSLERLESSLEFSEKEGLARYVALQPHYNLVSRDSYEGARERIAERYGLGVMPYYALASGFLTGKYRPGAPAVRGARSDRAASYLESARGPKVLAALDEIAAVHGVELASVAIAWLRVQPTVVAPIASASRAEQVPALLAGASLQLSKDEVARLTEASA
jgi:aryl-alcohol dehydrogenase-like predicted oxidoreductase